MGDFNFWLVGGGFSIGAVFAITIQRFRFCLVAGVSNLILIKDYRQVLAFASALLLAITSTQILEMMDIVAIADSGYRNGTLDWFGASVGGFIFGIGATFAGGCAARILVKTTEGSIHSLIALLSFSITAAIAQFGFLEQIRISITHATSITLTTDAGIASVSSLPQWLVLTAVVLGLLFFMLKCWQRSPDKTMLTVGIIVGLLVVSSWYITGVLAQDEFDPTNPSAMIISGPLARFGYLFISGRIPAMSFAISFVIGITIVSLLLALSTKQFKISLPIKGMTKMAVTGGSLMGLGAIMAYGCNIGQGLSGISTLSIESLLAVIGMVLGITAATKWMEKKAN